ncbi:hypothetical protein IFN73_09690 [Francisella tularensis subsp. holarctica]|nr:hypothetical protein [Francisella tularensis subsp. holarctica]
MGWINITNINPSDIKNSSWDILYLFVIANIILSRVVENINSILLITTNGVFG